MFPALPSDADFLEGRLAERGLLDAAREYARERLAVVQSSPADLLHDFGRARAVEGKLDEAIDLFRRALTADPRHLDSLFDLAVVHHRREELAQAVALYQKVLALAPDHADARFNLALALLGQGEREAAARQLAWLEAHREDSAAELRRILESTPPR
jgi:Flp pilus assembly protein TadD